MMVMFVSAAATTMVPAEDGIHHGLRSSNEPASHSGPIRQRSHSEEHPNHWQYDHTDCEAGGAQTSSIDGPEYDTYQNSRHHRGGEACLDHPPVTGTPRETRERHDTPKQTPASTQPEPADHYAEQNCENVIHTMW
jgi:hypothetical protein